MNIMYITTIGSTMNFFKSFISNLINDGHTVDIACNQKDSAVSSFYSELGCKTFDLSCSRSPFDKGNIRAIGEVKRILSENHYDIVHCHTPIAAAITRMAARKARKGGTEVIYTAHGFHFYKGAPLKNWLIYYPVEKLCAHFTDILITINKEDYVLAKRKLKAKQIEYVPGVGIDTGKFSACVIDKAEKRKELGIPNNAIWMLNIGELIPRKNQELLIRAMVDFSDVYLTIAGKGVLKETLEKVAKESGVYERVKLLGYRTDIDELCQSCDLFAFPSIHEGLPVSVMFSPYSLEECKQSIRQIIDRDIKAMGEYNYKKIQSFDISKINKMMYEIYGITEKKAVCKNG